MDDQSGRELLESQRRVIAVLVGQQSALISPSQHLADVRAVLSGVPIASSWTEAEQAALENELRHEGYDSVFSSTTRILKLAVAVPTKSVRDVAVRLKFMQEALDAPFSETSSDDDEDENSGRQKRARGKFASAPSSESKKMKSPKLVPARTTDLDSAPAAIDIALTDSVAKERSESLLADNDQLLSALRSNLKDNHTGESGALMRRFTQNVALLSAMDSNGSSNALAKLPPLPQVNSTMIPATDDSFINPRFI